MGLTTSQNAFQTENGTYYDSDSDDDGPCTGCFSLFCPPGEKDPLGSPLPSTPFGHKKKLKQIYGGLEEEDSTLRTNGDDNTNGFNGMKNAEATYIYEGDDGEQKLLQKWQMCEVLGVGSTSVCHRCVNRTTGVAAACKVIDKEQIEKRFEGMIDQFHSEIEALKCLKHPNIIRLYDVYTTSKRIYIVMELMAGGELFDYVVKKGTLSKYFKGFFYSALCFRFCMIMIHFY